MVCEPTVKTGRLPLGTQSDTTPLEFKTDVAKVVVPSEKVTVPVGVEPPVDPCTVAVNITVVPKAGAAGEVASEIDAALETVSWKVLELEFVLASPLYSALMVMAPAWEKEVVHVPVPPATATAPHPAMAVAPLLKLTVPLAAAGIMVAVSATLCPGLGDGGVAASVRLVAVLVMTTV